MQRQAVVVAQHFVEGDKLDRAVRYALLAGDQAEAVAAHAEAERAYRMASELAREIGNQAREAEALEKLGNTVLLTGHSPEAPDLHASAMQRY